MADIFIEGLIEWMSFWDAWHKWASFEPSWKHPIKYIKWYFSEPDYYKMIRKELNK